MALLLISTAQAGAQTVFIGVNLVNPMRGSAERRAALIAQLSAAHVASVRLPLADGEGRISDDAIDFVHRLQGRAIGVDAILNVQYSRNAPRRAAMPDRFPDMYAGSPLSSADPAASRSYFQSVFDRLDAAGVKLDAVELGNEINWTGFNADFPLPGEGRVFELSDLASDPEAKQIAAGLLRYLEIVKVLKQVRDGSRLNHATPILSAGLAEITPAYASHKQEDAVSIGATLGFLKAHGLRDLADGYGVHSYLPADPAADQQRRERFEQDIAPVCGAGRPCWITEWGFPNPDDRCPPDETARTALIGQFRALVGSLPAGAVGGMYYYSWDSSPWAKAPEPDSVYRCGGLTTAGQAAIEGAAP